MSYRSKSIEHIFPNNTIAISLDIVIILEVLGTGDITRAVIPRNIVPNIHAVVEYLNTSGALGDDFTAIVESARCTRHTFLRGQGWGWGCNFFFNFNYKHKSSFQALQNGSRIEKQRGVCFTRGPFHGHRFDRPPETEVIVERIRKWWYPSCIWFCNHGMYTGYEVCDDTIQRS